jgi:hypothetical protein
MTYEEIAVQALDVLHEFGDCQIVHVADTDGLRKAIRREARQRKVKISTWSKDVDFVWVFATEPSVLAHAYRTVTGSLAANIVSEAYDAHHEGRPVRRLIDPLARIVDADEVT